MEADTDVVFDEKWFDDENNKEMLDFIDYFVKAIDENPDILSEDDYDQLERIAKIVGY